MSLLPSGDKLIEITAWCANHITGDEKGQAQIFLDRIFQAFGQGGSLDVGGPNDGAAWARTSAGCGSGVRQRRGIKPNPTRSNPSRLSAMSLLGPFPADDPERGGRTQPADDCNNPQGHHPVAPGLRWGGVKTP